MITEKLLLGLHP